MVTYPSIGYKGIESAQMESKEPSAARTRPMRTPIPSPSRLDGELPAAFRAEIDSFLLWLEAENLAPKTRRGYGDPVEPRGQPQIRMLPEDIAEIDSGLTFEQNGLRAKLALDRAPTK